MLTKRLNIDKKKKRIMKPIIGITPLYDLLQTDKLDVNSRHHQGIKDLSPMLAVMAEAPDGLAEAVYIPGSNFVWGVRWHPEHMHSVSRESRRIFEAFAAACGKTEE